jgi:hypothetical protein
MIIDFHTHLFPESICAGRECYCASEPAFELLYRSPSRASYKKQEEDVVALARRGHLCRK